MSTQNKITTALTVALTFSTLTTATPALAWGRYYNNGGAVAGALIGGLAVGAMVGAIASQPRYYRSPAYGYPPPPPPPPPPYGYGGYGPGYGYW
jgi:hypothetical protein